MGVILPGGDTFGKNILEGEDVTGWFTSMPAGLIGEIHGVKAGAKEVKILVSGTPTETKKEPIQVTIPGEFITSGRSVTVKTSPRGSPICPMA